MAEQKIKYLVRVANTDLDGKKKVAFALCKIKGVSYSLANAICYISGVDKNAVIGLLPEDQVKKLTEAVINPQKIPSWMYNRQKDYETGENKHLLTADLTFTQQNDVKRMSMTKSYRGLRHVWKLTLRGQRNKSNHRRSKSKGASSIKKSRKKPPVKR